MSWRDNDLRIRPGRIRDTGRRAVRQKSFVGQVMRAARKAGHTGKGLGRPGLGRSSQFGRGRAAPSDIPETGWSNPRRGRRQSV
jgi:hypothetical protein